MLKGLPEPSAPPSLEQFISCFKFVATKEIEAVYNMSKATVEKEMKKLVLKQVVKRIPAKYGTFWKYTESSHMTDYFLLTFRNHKKTMHSMVFFEIRGWEKFFTTKQRGLSLHCDSLHNTNIPDLYYFSSTLFNISHKNLRNFRYF